MGYAVIAILGLVLFALLIRFLFNSLAVSSSSKPAQLIDFRSALLFSALLYLISISYLVVHQIYLSIEDQMATFLRLSANDISFMQAQYSSVNIPDEYTALVENMKATQERLANEWQMGLLLAIILGAVLSIAWGLGLVKRISLRGAYPMLLLALITLLLLIPAAFGYHLYTYAHGDLSQPQRFSIEGQTQSVSGTGSGSSSRSWEGLRFIPPYGSLWWRVLFWAAPLILLPLGWVSWRGYKPVLQRLSPSNRGQG